MRSITLLISFLLLSLICNAQLAGIDRTGFTSGGVSHLRLNGALGEVFVLGVDDCESGIQSGRILDSTACDIGVESTLYQAIHLYPNPGSDQVEIHLPGTTHNRLQLSISNMQGTEMLKTKWPGATPSKLIDISRLPAGVYFISITGSKKWRYETMRFVKI